MTSFDSPTASSEMASSPRSVLTTSTTPSSSGSETRFSRFGDLLYGRRDGAIDEESGENDGDGEGNSDDGGEEEEGADSSAFTDPSWYGSPFMRRESGGTTSLWQPNSPRSEAPGKLAKDLPSSPLTQKLDAYQNGLHLARRALLQLDADLDDGAKRGNHIPSVPNRQRSGKERQMANNPLTVLSSYPQCPTYVCAHCGTTLALQDELISKAFSGRDGKAYLFFSTLNIAVGPKEDRQLLTGLHTVADLSCATCQRSVGWSYIRAFEASQRYKEGKFILERAGLHKSNNWTLDEKLDRLSMH